MVNSFLSFKLHLTMQNMITLLVVLVVCSLLQNFRHIFLIKDEMECSSFISYEAVRSWPPNFQQRELLLNGEGLCSAAPLITVLPTVAAPNFMGFWRHWFLLDDNTLLWHCPMLSVEKILIS